VSEDPQLPSLPRVDPASADPGGSLSPELLASLLADGDNELAAWALAHALREAPRAQVFDGLLREAMRLVGERWETGQWSVAEEHLASRTLLRALERVRPDLGPEGRIGPLAVLAAPTGEHHMIGLVCLEQVLMEAGWTTNNMGADLPEADLARYVGRNDVSLVALSASHVARLDALAASVRAVREATPGRRVPVLVGGAVGAEPGLAASLDVDWMGTSVVAAAAFAKSVAREAGNTRPDTRPD
jgi:MerR family transcriptional regulator, light-induced transcriptional regulator